MKRIGNIGLIFMLIFMNFFSSVPPKLVKAEVAEEQKVIFESDFDNDEVGEVPSEFDVLEDGGTVRVVEDPDTTNKSVFLDDTSDEKFEIGRASCREREESTVVVASTTRNSEKAKNSYGADNEHSVG